jgi:hypothetical protein
VLAELHGVDLDEVEVETEDGGDEEEHDVAGEDEKEGGASYDAVVDVVRPFALKDEEWAEDEAGDKEGEEGDADEAPEIEEALLEECAETGGGVRLVAKESAGHEEKVNDEKKRDGGVAGDGPGGSHGPFVEMEVGFADGAEIKGAGEALGGEGVIEEFGELKVEGDGEEEGQGEIEDVGPEERGKAAQREKQAVDEDVAVFRHGVPWSEKAKANMGLLLFGKTWNQNDDLKRATATIRDNSKNNDNRRSFDSRFAHRSG